MHNQESPDPRELPDIGLIKRHAKSRRKAGGSMTYMQCLDQAAHELYGLRHFHEARARVKRATKTGLNSSGLNHADLNSDMVDRDRVNGDRVNGDRVNGDTVVASPLQYYLRTLQEYYLDF